jgi:hypothetical protein
MFCVRGYPRHDEGVVATSPVQVGKDARFDILIIRIVQMY